MKRQRNTTPMKEQTRNTKKEISKLSEKEFRIMIVKMIKNLENKMGKMQESINKDLEEFKKVKLLSRVRLCDPMDCSLPGSSIHGIFQARVLEWVAISFSRRSSQSKDWTQVSHIVGRRFTIRATREHTEANNTITVIKNTLEGINSRTSEAEEHISELEDKNVDITSEDQDKVKSIKRTEDSLRDLWDNIKRTNIRIIGVPEEEEEEEKKKGYGKIFEEIIVENFPNMEKEIVKFKRHEESHTG